MVVLGQKGLIDEDWKLLSEDGDPVPKIVAEAGDLEDV